MPRTATNLRGARGRGSLALLLACAAGLGAVPSSGRADGAPTSCPDADGRPAAVGTARSAAALACLVAYERRAAGQAPLTTDPRAQQAAQRHADDMAARNYFGHDAPAPAPDGTSGGDRLDAAGYPWVQQGENLGRGQPTPRVVMSAWLASAGHCTNLMAAGFTNLGIGVSAGPGGPYWVLELARPEGAATPGGVPAPCPRSAASPAPDGAPAPGGGDVARGGPAGAAPDGGSPTGAGPPSGGGSTSRGGTAPGAGGPGTNGPAGSGTGAPSSADGHDPVRVSARRTGRRVVVRVSLPAGPDTTPVVIRVRQRRRVVRVLRLVLAPGREHRLGVTVPAARAGRVGVRTGGSTVVARFR